MQSFLAGFEKLRAEFEVLNGAAREADAERQLLKDVLTNTQQDDGTHQKILEQAEEIQRLRKENECIQQLRRTIAGLRGEFFQLLVQIRPPTA